jgi:phosphate transport system permease protein
MGLTLMVAIAVALVLGAIVVILGVNAMPAIATFGLKFLISGGWNPVAGREQYGALPMIYGTLVSSILGLSLALPLGLGTAIGLSEDFVPAPIQRVLIGLVELLAAIPSVVYGLWGIFVLIPWTTTLGQWLHHHWGNWPWFGSAPVGPGLLPAGIVLGIMILPMITVLARDALAALPPDLRQASLGLGATRWTTIIRVLLPAARSGIAGGVMLAFGRALGETMAVTMVIGNANQINLSLLAPGTTIAALLANQFAEAKDMQIAALMYAALVLIILTLSVNLAATAIIDHLKTRVQ